MSMYTFITLVCPIEWLPFMRHGYMFGIYKSLCDAHTPVQGCTFTLQLSPYKLQFGSFSYNTLQWIAKISVTSVFIL